MSDGYDKLLEEFSKNDPSHPIVAPLVWAILALFILLANFALPDEYISG